MKVLAIVHPLSLVAVELRETLGRNRGLWGELRLLSSEEEEVGTLTEVGGAAAMVGRADEGLAGVDIAFFCGPVARNRPLLGRLPGGATAVLLSPDAEPADGRPFVDGVNLDDFVGTGVPASPHPGVVALAHLVHPLRRFSPRRVAATLLQPASVHGTGALDEVLDQTRSLLRFEPPSDRQCFRTQIAFNLLPGAAGPLAAQLRTVLGKDAPELAVTVVQAAVFHGFAVSAYVELEGDPGADAVRAALAAHPANELAVAPDLLGPIDAAQSVRVLIGAVEPAPGVPGGYWIWAVMDNLTRGGALNALAILEAVLGRVTN